MYKNSLVTIEDLSNEEIEDILDLSLEMQGDLRAFPSLASGYIMASLFLEPSTRTRGSFESAMKRLGGQTITTADVKSSSLEKGESLADTIRVWSSYADLIVMRHPWEGAARLAADYAQVPIVNAGDGGSRAPHPDPLRSLYSQGRARYPPGVKGCPLRRPEERTYRPLTDLRPAPIRRRAVLCARGGVGAARLHKDQD